MRWLVVITLAACGRLQFEPGAADAVVVVVEDAADAAVGPDCWPAWHAGTPVFDSVGPIAELALADKQGNPWLTLDGLTLYFDSGTGNTEIFAATRPGRDQAFGTPVALPELTSTNEDTGLVLSDDGLVGVIGSSRPGSQGFDLWHVERTVAQATFMPPSLNPFAALNDSQNQYDGYLLPDGLTVIYSESDGAGGNRLRQATRSSRTVPFAAPVMIPGTGTISIEADPDLSRDRRVLAFSATFPLQLYAAVRASPNAAFGAPFELSAINGPNHDGDPAFSADGCELFFVSDRGGNRDLYRATLTP